MNLLTPKKPQTISAAIETITPSTAQEWLAQNEDNRNISRRHVKRLTQAIQQGRWEITNQGIGIDTEGNLVDGQHRLSAIVEAGQPVQALVVRDVEPNTFKKVDIGRSRNATQFMTGRYKAIRAGITRYYPEVLQAVGSESFYATGMIDPDLQFAILEDKKEQTTIEDMAEIAGRLQNRYRMMPAPVGAAFALIARQSRANHAAVYEFAEQIYSGSKDDTTIEALVRIYMYDGKKDDPASVRRWRLYSTTIKAWDYWAQDKQIKNLRMGSERKPMRPHTL